MSIEYGLPLVGFLILIFVLVRNAARKDRSRRGKKSPQGGRFYWEPPSRIARFATREDAGPDTVPDDWPDTMGHTGPPTR